MLGSIGGSTLRVVVTGSDNHTEALAYAGLPVADQHATLAEPRDREVTSGKVTYVGLNEPHDLEVLVGKRSRPRYELCLDASTGGVYGVHVFCLSDPPTLAELEELRAFVSSGRWDETCAYCKKGAVDTFGSNGVGYHGECEKLAQRLGERRWEKRLGKR